MPSIDISSIVSAILGGLLAFGGVYFAQRSTTKQTSKTLRRDKLEELYTLLARERKSAGHDLMECSQLKIKTIHNEIENPLDRINMIISLYFPSLKKSAQGLIDINNLYAIVLHEYWEYFEKRNERPPQNLFQPVQTLCYDLEAACDKMLIMLEEEFLKLI